MAPQLLKKVETATRDVWSAEQLRLASQRVSKDDLDWSIDEAGRIQGLTSVAGVDLSFFPDARHAVAAVVVLSFPDLEVIGEHCATVEVTVPYKPGFLAFREVPPLAKMLQSLDSTHDLQAVMVDGNGAYHPRSCGSATHLGVVTHLPTVGVAKEVLLVGRLNARRAERISRGFRQPGDWEYFGEDGEEALAALLKPGSGSRTLVVSSGHRVSLRSSVLLTRAVCPHSIPEPIRQADLRSRRAVAAWLAGTPLPVLSDESGPAAKRRRCGGRGRKNAAAPIVVVEGQGAEAQVNLERLVEMHSAPGKVSASKVLMWRAKPRAAGPEAAAEPLLAAPAALAAEAAPGAAAAEELLERPSPPRSCCLLAGFSGLWKLVFRR